MALGPRLMRTGSQSVWGCVKEGYEGQFPFLPKVCVGVGGGGRGCSIVLLPSLCY